MRSKEALKTGSDIIIDILINEPEQPVCTIFENRFSKQRLTLRKSLKE